RVRGRGADVCVDFVEDEKRNRIVRRQRGFDREHQARDFAAGSDDAQRFQRFAWVRGEKEFNRIKTARIRFFEWSELRFEFGLFESEIAQVLPNRIGKFRCRLRAELPQGVAGPRHLLSNSLNFSTESSQLLIASFNFSHPLGRALAKRDYFG